MLSAITNRKNGYVLTLTLVVMVFATIIITTMSMQLNRTLARSREYSKVRLTQNVCENLVNLSTGFLSDRYAKLNFNDEWSGVNDFIEFVSNRGGLEGYLWGEHLSVLKAQSCLLLTNNLEFRELLNTQPWIEGFTATSVLYESDAGYFLITSAERSGITRYAYASLAEITEVVPVLAACTGRTFSELKTTHGNGKLGKGDYFAGPVIIFGDAIVNSGDPANIFNGGLAAQSLALPPETSSYDYTKIATSVDEYLAAEVSETIEKISSLASITVDMGADIQLPSSLTEDTLLVVNPPSPSTPIYVSFNDGKEDKEQITFKAGGSSFSINLGDYDGVEYLNVLVNGDVVFDYNDEVSDPHKAQKVIGKFDITVTGDVTVNANLIYDDLYSAFNNGNGNSGVANQGISSLKDLSEVLSASTNDLLSITALGGNVSINYTQGNGNSSHGIKTITARLKALPKDGKGGKIKFPDIDQVSSEGLNSQLFVVGGIIGQSIEVEGSGTLDDYLDNFFAVPDRKGASYLKKKLQINGLRSW